jgi:hypothetical protein
VAGAAGAPADNGHGGARIAPGVRLMPLVVGTEGSVDMVPAAEAVRHAADHGADVINLSFGGPASGWVVDHLRAAIRYAGQRGSVVVAAAGNDGAKRDATAPVYPAPYDEPGILTVGSSTRAETVAAHSAYGAVSVDQFAPGESIVAPARADRYSLRNGTSLASPLVAGAVALHAAVDPAASPAQLVRAVLADTARHPAYAGRSVSGGRLSLPALGERASGVGYSFTGAGQQAVGTVRPTVTLRGRAPDGALSVRLALGMRVGDEVLAVSGADLRAGGVGSVTDDDGQRSRSASTGRGWRRASRCRCRSTCRPGSTSCWRRRSSTAGRSPALTWRRSRWWRRRPERRVPPRRPWHRHRPRPPHPARHPPQPVPWDRVRPVAPAAPAVARAAGRCHPAHQRRRPRARPRCPARPPRRAGPPVPPHSRRPPRPLRPHAGPTPAVPPPGGPAPSATTGPGPAGPSQPTVTPGTLPGGPRERRFDGSDPYAITALSPDRVSTAGGQLVTVEGRALPADPRVRVGTSGVADIWATTSTRLTFVAPPRVAGRYDVMVSAPGGRVTVLAADLEYVAPEGGPGGAFPAPAPAPGGSGAPGGPAPGDPGTATPTRQVVAGPGGLRLVRGPATFAGVTTSLWDRSGCDTGCPGVAP